MAKRWTETEDKFIRKMRDAGEGYREIGYHLDRTPQAVQQRAFKLGISKKRKVSLPVDLPAYTYDMAEVPEDVGYLFEEAPRKPWWRRLLSMGG